MKERKSAKLQRQNGHVSPFNVAKLLDPDASWDKDQLCDVLHWIRQFMGVVFGLVWGAIPLIGAKWILVFLVLSSAIIYAYYNMILKIDEEEFGGHGALLQEGLFASFSVFLAMYKIVATLILVIAAFRDMVGDTRFLLSSDYISRDEVFTHLRII